MGLLQLVLVLYLWVFLHQLIVRILVGYWPIKVYQKCLTLPYTYTQMWVKFLGYISIFVAFNAILWCFLLLFTPLWVMWIVLSSLEVFVIIVLIKKSKN